MRMITKQAALAALIAALAAGSAFAQSVPIPTAKPQQNNAQAPRPSAPVAQQQAAPRPAAPVAQPQSNNPFAALLGNNKPAAATGQIDQNTQVLIDRVSGYLTNMRQLTGSFRQVGPDGRRTEGQFYIQKPGRIRFEYDPPAKIEVVADGSSVIVRDRDLATQDVYPLSQTPLRFLLADRIDLMKDTHLVAVYADDVFVTVVCEERNGIVGTSKLMIMFDAKDLQLKQWTITDPQGFNTTVAVFNLDTVKRPDPNLFKIDYTRYQ